MTGQTEEQFPVPARSIPGNQTGLLQMSAEFSIKNKESKFATNQQKYMFEQAAKVASQQFAPGRMKKSIAGRQQLNQYKNKTKNASYSSHHEGLNLMGKSMIQDNVSNHQTQKFSSAVLEQPRRKPSAIGSSRQSLLPQIQTRNSQQGQPIKMTGSRYAANAVNRTATHISKKSQQITSPFHVIQKPIHKTMLDSSRMPPNTNFELMPSVSSAQKQSQKLPEMKVASMVPEQRSTRNAQRKREDMAPQNKKSNLQTSPSPQKYPALPKDSLIQKQKQDRPIEETKSLLKPKEAPKPAAPKQKRNVMDAIDDLLQAEDDIKPRRDDEDEGFGSDHGQDEKKRGFRDNIDESKHQALLQWEQERREQEYELAAKEQIIMQEEEQTRIRLKYEEDLEMEQAQLLEELKDEEMKQTGDDQQKTQVVESNITEEKKDAQEEASSKLHIIRQSTQKSLKTTLSSNMVIEELVQVVVVEKAELILGVRSKFMVNFIVLKFLDLDLAYALQLCISVLSSYNASVHGENRLLALLAANTIRIKTLAIEFLQKAKKSASLDEKCAAVLADSSKEEDKLINFSQQQLLIQIQDASAIYEQPRQTSLHGQALCSFQKAMLLESRLTLKEKTVDEFTKAADLFGKAYHLKGQLLAHEHILKNSDLNTMEEQKVHEIFEKIEVLKTQIAEKEEEVVDAQVFSQDTLLMLECIYNFDQQ